jgi:poly(beta-D-mannuronate) lyase
MTTFTSTILARSRIVHARGVGALLFAACGVCPTANAALQPPAGYFRAVRVQPGATAPCQDPPRPFTAELDFPSKYAGSGKARDEINPQADAQFKRATQPITRMEKGFTTTVTKYMQSGDPALLKCALDWLSTWAGARALEGPALNHTGKSLRKWSLASISSAYLRLKFSTSAPLRNYPAEAARAETWMSDVADRVKSEWPPDDPIGKVNNHYYWAAWAMMATAVATNRRDLFDQAAAIYHVFATQVDPDGYLPNELARSSRAAGYHIYAMLPIAMLAAFGKANGTDLAGEGGHALTRLAQRVQIAIDEPAGFATKVGTRQHIDAADSKSAWAWLEPYCWTLTCTPELQTRLSSQRPLAVTRLGGDLTTVFSAEAPPDPVTGGLDALNAVCRSSIDSRNFDDALSLCKRVNFDASKLAPGSQAHIASLINIGDIKRLVENYVDADAYYASALMLVELAGGRDSPQAAQLLKLMVEIKAKRGKFLDAEVLMRRLLATLEKTAGPEDVPVAVARAGYADLLSQSRQFPEAELAYGRAIGVLEHAGTESTEAYALAVRHLAEMYERRAQYIQAEVQYRRLLDIVERGGLGAEALATTLDQLANVCEEQGKWTEAASFYRREMNTLSAAGSAPQSIGRVQAKLSELNSVPRGPTS